MLDIGCRSGLLGAAFKRYNPTAHVIGVESDEEAARLAATRLDQVYICNFDFDLTQFTRSIPPGGFDCIIYSDVLESLQKPWNILKRQTEMLAKEGTVLLRLSNVEHWRSTEQILCGTWDYGDFDAYHRGDLRCSSLASMERTLRHAGLQPIDMIADVKESAEREAFVEALSPSLRRLGVDTAEYLNRAAPSHYVWRAGYRIVRRLPVVSTMLNPIGGVSHVRVTEPMQALATDPSLRTGVLQFDGSSNSDLEEPGIFIFHRPLLAGKEGLSRVRRLIRSGWVVVCEFDDHPDYISILQRPDIQNFRAVHAIQTSTDALANVLRIQNPEIAVFHNAILRLQEPVNYVSGAPLTLFFAGLNREAEWPPYLKALNVVAARFGEKLRFRVVSDRGLFDALNTPHKSFTPLCNYDTYRSLLGNSEVSFMPLSDTPFNRCKSDLKFVEAAAHRVTTLASTVVYAGSIEHGRTGLVFNNAAELEEQLSRLSADPQAGRRLAEASRDYVSASRMMAYQVARRSAWYHSLWARRDELGRALLARVPELA